MLIAGERHKKGVFFYRISLSGDNFCLFFIYCIMKKKENKFMDKLNLPKDITQQAFVMTAVGNGEIYIENYRGILDYSDSLIRIQAVNLSIIIEGKNLNILYYTDEDMIVKGTVCCVKYLV